MGPGTLYGTLSRLVDGGLIEETRIDRDLDGRRRYYALTPAGRAVAATETRRLRGLVAAVTRYLPAT